MLYLERNHGSYILLRLGVMVFLQRNVEVRDVRCVMLGVVKLHNIPTDDGFCIGIMRPRELMGSI